MRLAAAADQSRKCQRSFQIAVMALLLAQSSLCFASNPLKIVCEARETLLAPGCGSTVAKSQFEAQYDDRGTAVNSTGAKLDASISFHVGAVRQLRTLGADIRRSRGMGKPLTVAHAGRLADQADDYVFISYADGADHGLGDCNDQIFEMVCMLAPQSDSAIKIAAKLDRCFDAAK